MCVFHRYARSTPTTMHDRDTTENMQTEDHLNIKKNDWVWIITLAVFFICAPFFLMWCKFLKKRSKTFYSLAFKIQVS